jgi:hypothetical protein
MFQIDDSNQCSDVGTKWRLNKQEIFLPHRLRPLGFVRVENRTGRALHSLVMFCHLRQLSIASLIHWYYG